MDKKINVYKGKNQQSLYEQSFVHQYKFYNLPKHLKHHTEQNAYDLHTPPQVT